MTTIYTIGHGSSDFPSILEILRAHGIATLIDVRSQPYSQHAPDFTRHRLERWCAVAGIGYRWMGRHLGGHPRDPMLLDGRGEPDTEAIRTDSGFRAALATIGEVSAGGRVAVLCAEENPAHCHRSRLIAPELIARGHRVVHLRHDGSAAPHQDPLDFG